MTHRDAKIDTRIVHAGRSPEDHHGTVNPPAWRASTVIAPTVRELNERGKKRFDHVVTYGRHGTPTTFALEEAVAEIEGGRYCVSVGSGLAAITATLTALLSAGDHLLMVDTVYGPTRAFCDGVLARMGVQTTYYDPGAGADIAALMRPETKVVFTESPGSHTFELQDIPAIAEAAHAGGAVVIMDNTWGILSFQPFTKGVDVSVQAATKYIVGHSDAMLGTITCADKDLFLRIRTSVALFGYAAGSEEAWLGLRGLRTLGVRLRQQFEAGVRVAAWLQSRPEVAQVLHPALASHPGHALWKRDFNGGCGLFGVELKPVSTAAVEAMLDGYDLFALGYSWGGFESLVVPTHVSRTATPWPFQGPLVRYHVGLEDPADLISDLERGFDRLRSFE